MDVAQLSERRRLNPFAFPAETNVRFVLLILAVVMLASSMATLLPSLFNVLSRLSAASGGSVVSTVPRAPVNLERIVSKLAFQVGALVLILAVSAAVYLTHPARIRRQMRLSTADSEQHQAIRQEIPKLAELVDLSPIPQVEIGEGLRSQQAQVFGIHGRYVVGLGGGNRLLIKKSRDLFRTQVLHEMAHIANRDVGISYLAEALWYGVTIVCSGLFVLLLVVSTMLTTLGSILSMHLDIARFLFNSLINLLAFPVILYITALPPAITSLLHAGLLRVREFYADWRVAAWGMDAHIQRLIESKATQQDAQPQSRLFHPSLKQRLAVLRNPAGLFHVPLDLALTVGFLLGFVVSGLDTLAFKILAILVSGLKAIAYAVTDAMDIYGASASSLVQGMVNLVTIAYFLSMCLFLSYFVAATVGLQVQRNTVADLVVGRTGYSRYLRLLGLAALISVGMESGLLISPPYQLSAAGILIGGEVSPLRALLILPWLILFAAVNFMGLFYVDYWGQRILARHLGKAPPKWKRRFLTWATSILLCLPYFSLLAGREAFTVAGLESLGLTFLVSLAVAVLFYGIVFGATWVINAKSARPLYCTVCRKATQHTIAVGQVCEHCGNELAPWLFAHPPTISLAESQSVMVG